VDALGLNPHTGRAPGGAIGGVRPDAPIITPDGNSFAFDYRMNLSDLYTVRGVR
jgi:hypothetical protein